MDSEDQDPGTYSLELIAADDLQEALDHDSSEIHPDKVWTPEALFIEVNFRGFYLCISVHNL